MGIVGKWFGFARQEIFEEGIRAHERGDAEATIEAFEEFLQHHPSAEAERLANFYLANACARLAESYREAGVRALALQLIRRALKLAPSYPDLHLTAARLNRESGLLEDEARECGEALHLNPAYREAQAYEVARLFRCGQPRQAFELADRLGLAYEEAKQASTDEEAQAVFDKLATPSAAGIQLRLRLANLYLRDQLYVEAAAEYERVLPEAEGYPDVHCHYGQALWALGREEEACAQFQRAVDLNPAYAEARGLLSRCHPEGSPEPMRGLG